MNRYAITKKKNFQSADIVTHLQGLRFVLKLSRAELIGDIFLIWLNF